MKGPLGFFLWDILTSDSKEEQAPKLEEEPFDEYDWDNPDNCSDREYMDDDDYDDFD